MCRPLSKHQTSHRSSSDKISAKETIGDLFRDYGEDYIQKFKPYKQQIKLIRAIRICKTPALGGRVVICKSCGHKHYFYNSCGHSQCMLCQTLKREQWMDRLKSSLLQVPYMHVVFTMPHHLNGICRMNQKVMYSIIMKSAWNTINKISKEQGFQSGMTSVLHTFGSDLKYHIHVHALVTYGGINKNNEWQYPIKKYGLSSYRYMCSTFKSEFIKMLMQHNDKNELEYHSDINEMLPYLQKQRWVVHTTRPTMNTEIIENYLSRYINRIAVSKARLAYISENQKVNILYNDYKNQQKGKVAPKLMMQMHPMVAIDHILQHVLPEHFQKTRSYGLHNKTSKLNATISQKLKRNKNTIRTIFQIITTLINQNPYKCENCNATEYDVEALLPNRRWIFKFIREDSLKSPPTKKRYIKPTNKKEDLPASYETVLNKNTKKQL